MAEALLDSLPPQSAPEVQGIERAWRDEVLRRIREVQRGDVEPEPLPEVKQRLRETLDRGS